METLNNKIDQIEEEYGSEVPLKGKVKNVGYNHPKYACGLPTSTDEDIQKDLQASNLGQDMKELLAARVREIEGGSTSSPLTKKNEQDSWMKSSLLGMLDNMSGKLLTPEEIHHEAPALKKKIEASELPPSQKASKLASLERISEATEKSSNLGRKSKVMKAPKEQEAPKIVQKKKRVIFHQRIICPDENMDKIMEDAKDDISFSSNPKWHFMDSADIYEMKKCKVLKERFIWSIILCAMKISKEDDVTELDQFKETPFWTKDLPPPHAAVQLLNLIDYSLVCHEKTSEHYKYEDKNKPTLTPRYPCFRVQYGTFGRKAVTKIAPAVHTDLEEAKFIGRIIFNYGGTEVYKFTNVNDRKETYEFLLDSSEYIYVSRDDIEDFEITTSNKSIFIFEGRNYMKPKDFSRTTVVFDLYQPNCAERVLAEIREKYAKSQAEYQYYKIKYNQLYNEFQEKKSTKELPDDVPVIDDLIAKISTDPPNIKELVLKMEQELAKLTEEDAEGAAKAYDSDEDKKGKYEPDFEGAE